MVWKKGECVNMNSMGRLGILFLLGGLAGTMQAQSAEPIGGVYTCVDAKGRKLTADRPIPDCTDREQKVLNPSGTVKAKIGPTLTADERAAQEKNERKAAEEVGRAGDEKRRNRALVIRFPNKGVHDQERNEALAKIEAVTAAASTRMEELGRQRVAIDAEMEFYTKDPSKAPAYMRRQLEENIQSQTVQRNFIAEQETEARRARVRFDDELVRLRVLWSMGNK
jgi:hypothetical protein